MEKSHIEKDLEWEANIKDNITYIPVAGSNENYNFRSPDSYVFLFFEKSAGWHSIDFEHYENRDNQLHISFPGQIHSWQTQEIAQGHKLILSKSFVETRMIKSVFSSLYLNYCPVIDLPNDKSQKLFNELIILNRELLEEESNEVLKLRTQLILTIIDGIIKDRINEQLNTENRSPITFKFLEMVENHFKEEKSVIYYAKNLMVGANYLTVLLKKELNKKPKDLIIKRIQLEAQRLLLGSNLSIKEIAFELGFQSIPAFSTFMKNITGKSPSIIRAEVQTSQTS
ncbi:MAG: helix-turn-helix domain-containing protein [Sphingobacterium sp.]|jgi:YesN/AraC family two-component response regulator|nr:helix-turn-helix domain-containing protein [Sphingobacterium sp.]